MDRRSFLKRIGMLVGISYVAPVALIPNIPNTPTIIIPLIPKTLSKNTVYKS